MAVDVTSKLHVVVAQIQRGATVVPGAVEYTDSSGLPSRLAYGLRDLAVRFCRISRVRHPSLYDSDQVQSAAVGCSGSSPFSSSTDPPPVRRVHLAATYAHAMSCYYPFAPEVVDGLHKPVGVLIAFNMPLAAHIAASHSRGRAGAPPSPSQTLKPDPASQIPPVYHRMAASITRRASQPRLYPMTAQDALMTQRCFPFQDGGANSINPAVGGPVTFRLAVSMQTRCNIPSPSGLVLQDGGANPINPAVGEPVTFRLAINHAAAKAAAKAGGLAAAHAGRRATQVS